MICAQVRRQNQADTYATHTIDYRCVYLPLHIHNVHMHKYMHMYLHAYMLHSHIHGNRFTSMDISALGSNTFQTGPFEALCQKWSVFGNR